MEVFFLVPRPGRDGVAVQAVLEVIRIAAQLLAQPRCIVVHQGVIPVAPAGKVQMAIVEDDVLEADLRTFGEDVHLADGLCLVAAFGEFSGDGDGVIPRHAILIPDAAVRSLTQACEEPCPCGDACWAGGIGAGEARTAQCHLVQVRGVDHGMAVDAQAIPTPLVDTDQDDIGAVRHGFLHRPYLLCGVVA